MAASGSREEILADFQACTGIDDVGEAILHLEECNWNLLQAVTRVLPQDTQTIPTVNADTPQEGAGMKVVLPVEGISSVPTLLSHVSQSIDFVMPSTSHTNYNKLLRFNVSCNGKTSDVLMAESETVATLKLRLYGEFSIPPCNQDISGFPANNDSKQLSSLQLQSPVKLVLRALTPMADDTGPNDEVSDTFLLKIEDKVKNKSYSLNFPGSKHILEVKRDMYTLNDVPVRNQLWVGWPTHSNDTMTLSECGVPNFTLTVSKQVNSPSKLNNKEEKKKKENNMDSDHSDDSEDDFEDASESINMEDEIFLTDVPNKRPQPLIPDNIDDDMVASYHLSTEFYNRYGECHPMFYQGSLEEAVKEACLRPAKERKLVAVYLHHDGSVLSNVFCMQSFCSESVVAYLANNFVVWGWDLTFESNRARLLTTISRQFGNVAAETLRSIDQEKLPVVLIIMRNRSTSEIYSVIHGTVSVDELLTNLIQAVDVFLEQQSLEVREEEDREARETVKREQDEAYRESLQADRAKEELKKVQREEEERLQKERKEENEQLRKQQIQQEVREEEERQQALEDLPPEPPESEHAVVVLRFRLPHGEVLMRRFSLNSILRHIFDFLLIKGYSVSQYRLLTSFPKKDVTTFASSTVLKDILQAPEMLTLEER